MDYALVYLLFNNMSIKYEVLGSLESEPSNNTDTGNLIILVSI